MSEDTRRAWPGRHGRERGLRPWLVALPLLAAGCMTSYEDETSFLPDTFDTRRTEVDGAVGDATRETTQEVATDGELGPGDATADAPEAAGDATNPVDGADDSADAAGDGALPPADATGADGASDGEGDGGTDTVACECPPGWWCDEAGRCTDHVCGNGVLEAGETCDPPASCPTRCDDGQPCSEDVLVGEAASCTAQCEHAPVMVCRGGDGCCPEGCGAGTDQDCSASCGDGLVHAPETCDPPASCPADCDDGEACTNDLLLGSAAACSATCSHTRVTACTSGDGCCPSGCNALGDDDCEPVCNNGVVEPGETCDPPGSCPNNCNDGDACTSDAMTGVSILCTRTCTHTAISVCSHSDGCCPSACNAVSDRDCDAVCGNSVVEPGETCDPPGSCPTSCNDGLACTRDTLIGSSASCTRACSFSAITTCTGGDGCCPSGCNANNDRDCQPVCGNRVVETGETCDGSCPTSCNDGNACTRDTLSGSSASCTSVCSTTAITTCTSGDGCCRSGCTALDDSDCPAVCGNGVIEPGETCDPSGTCPSSCDDGDACTVDTLSGSACARECRRSTITACVGGDGCCPGACGAASDYDCAGGCSDCALDCTNDATWPTGWREFEDMVIALVNQRRAAGATCGTTYHPPVGALAFDPLIRIAARCHSLDMATRDYFAHLSPEGDDVGDRLYEVGYAWQAAAENLGGGPLTPAEIVAGWMSSPGHCTNIMTATYTETAVGYVAVDGSDWYTYWTQVFAAPLP